jgi:UDP-N-acetyl-D-mannosaminuronic acid dehydrogenase
VELVSLVDATAKADVVVLLVDHSAFKRADPVALGLGDKAVVDTRGVWR